MNQPTVRSEDVSVAGDIWTAVITGIQYTHSLIIEAWGANGGIVRILPSGRDEVKVALRFLAPGRTILSMTFRDARLGATHAVEAPVDVVSHGAASGYRRQQVWGGPMGFRSDITAASEAPLFQLVDASRPAMHASAQGYGDMNGPTEAEVGETINVRFTTPLSAVSVRFQASNAVVGFVGPMPIYDVTAETSAQMTAEGSATIYGTAYDNNGMAVHEATHVVQVRSKRVDGPKEKSLSELAADMERSIEERLRTGLNLNR